MAATSPQIIDQLLADRRAYRWPRSPKFNLRKRAISGGDLPGVELSSVGVETCMADRLDIPNDRQDVGDKLGRLRLAAHAHALDGAGGIGRAQPLSARLGGR